MHVSQFFNEIISRIIIIIKNLGIILCKIGIIFSSNVWYYSLVKLSKFEVITIGSLQLIIQYFNTCKPIQVSNFFLVEFLLCFSRLYSFQQSCHIYKYSLVLNSRYYLFIISWIYFHPNVFVFFLYQYK